MNCDAHNGDPADFTQAGSAMSCCSSETCVFEVESITTDGLLERTSSAEVLYEMQAEYPCCSSYMSSTQTGTGVTASQRASIVDNMIAAAFQIGLSNDSLFMAVACLDRYLALKPTPLNLLQPAGIACLWIGAKYEQLTPPSAAVFAQLAKGPNGIPLGCTTSAKQLLVMLEESILKTLDYRLAAVVTAIAFKHRIMQQLADSSAYKQLSQQQVDVLYSLTSYLTEVCLLEYKLLPWLPSQLAAASFAYAHTLLGLTIDPDQLQQLTQHSLVELQRPMEYCCALHTILCKALQQHTPYAVTVKYCQPALQRVATLPCKFFVVGGQPSQG
eukprot:gene13597-13722_t